MTDIEQEKRWLENTPLHEETIDKYRV